MVSCCMGWLGWRRTVAKSCGSQRKEAAGFPQLLCSPWWAPAPAPPPLLSFCPAACLKPQTFISFPPVLVFTLWLHQLTSERKHLFVKEPYICLLQTKEFKQLYSAVSSQLPISFSGQKKINQLWSPNAIPKNLLGTSLWKWGSLGETYYFRLVRKEMESSFLHPNTSALSASVLPATFLSWHPHGKNNR